MTVHTLVGRRTFAALREEHGQYEACLSLGLLPSPGASARSSTAAYPRASARAGPGEDDRRRHAARRVHRRHAGRRHAVQAATAQVLVLFAIMAAQTITAGLAERLICARRLLPHDLHAALID